MNQKFVHILFIRCRCSAAIVMAGSLSVFCSLFMGCDETYRGSEPPVVSNASSDDTLAEADISPDEDVGNNACEVTNADMKWIVSDGGMIQIQPLEQAEKYFKNRSIAVRECLMAGLFDLHRFAACHFLLLEIYDPEHQVILQNISDRLPGLDYATRVRGIKWISFEKGTAAPIYTKSEMQIFWEVWKEYFANMQQGDEQAT